jgi:predicted metal-dependent HD superfamily phosphohydrolase
LDAIFVNLNSSWFAPALSEHMKITQDLVQKSGTFVTELLQNNLPDTIEFHRLEHTVYVVDAAEMIGKNSGLNTREINLVKIAAWFHDTGYAQDPINHEAESCRIAEEFLKEQKVNEADISVILEAIMATSVPQRPKDMISKVLCDADLMHVGEPDYFERIEKMRREMASLHDEKVSKRSFHKMSLRFFDKHNFHTDFARKEFTPKRDKTLELIKKQLFIMEQEKEQKRLEKEQKKAKGKGYSRGVESMFRLTARNQINLSSIADNKSNILISVNAIIMSITMTVLVTRFEEVPNIILPTLIFLVFCLITIVFAILSTRPNISGGTFSKEDIQQNKVNLLFFGNFYNMQLDEYEWAIGELMKNDENLYGTMIKDQYALGKVLARKYKLLRVAYNVFMVGIIISVLAFVLAFTSF